MGPARAERLAHLGYATVADLLLALPRALERQGGRVAVRDAGGSIGESVVVRGRWRAVRIYRRGRRATVRADLEDATGRLPVFWFNQPWRLAELREGAADGREVTLCGRPVKTRAGVALGSPRVLEPGAVAPAAGSLLPIYATTAGVGQGLLRGLVGQAVAGWADALRDPLDERDLAPLELPRLSVAVRHLQDPPDEAAFRVARRRLAFERCLASQARFQRRRARWDRETGARALDPAAAEALLEDLPHRPTPDQRAAVRAVAGDLARRRPMRRLLQGDVGSGKTLVAQHAMALVGEAGGQAALLAPTELLARQHFEALGPWFEARGLRVVALFGSDGAAQRRAARAALAGGSAAVAVGTHALVGEDVRFAALDLVVIDEQQRFGVAQKRALLGKGTRTHVLLLSATPIPRTLALSLHGDLEVSRIHSRPPGRGTLATHLVPPKKRAAMLRFLDERLSAGERVFWVCPRIESEAQGGPGDGRPGGAAERAHRELAASDLARHGLELVHGRLPPEERARRLARFREGGVRLLVGSTVLEVGIDVPEATVMVIDGARGLGLAQLHQLRGRVGRGPGRSWCLILVDEASRERLAVLRESQDGFRIAEEDLRQRGMGELFGERQAGHRIEGLEDPLLDEELVRGAARLLARRPELVERYARRIGAMDPELV